MFPFSNGLSLESKVILVKFIHLFFYILQIGFVCGFWIVNGMMVGICCGGDLFMSIGGDGF